MYNRSCYATLTYNNTIVQKRVGGNFTGLKLKPKKLEVLAFTYEINVVGTSVWSLSKIYKVIGSIKYDLASFLNLDLKGSSKYKVEEKLDINGSKEFTLEALFPINGNKKFKYEMNKDIVGKRDIISMLISSDIL